jgi:hypothetical protein
VRKLNPTTLFLFFIVTTIPFLSGAVPPLSQSIYTFLILLICGIWLALNFDSIEFKTFTFKSYLVFIILGLIILTAVNLPLNIIQFMSPVRAESLTNALGTGQLTDITTSLSYYIPGSRYYAVYGLALLLYFFFASAFLKWEENQKIILWIITFIGTMEALYGLLQLIFPSTWIIWLPAGTTVGNFPRGTFTDHNHYAAFLNICWPISLVMGISMVGQAIEKSEMFKITKKNLSAVDRLQLLFCRQNLPYWCTVFMIMSVILSRSVAGIVVMFILIVLSRIVIPFPRRIKVTISAMIYLGLLSYGLMTGVQVINDTIIVIPETVMAKYHFWIESLSMLKEHLITGIGMGSYQYISPLYLSDITESRLFTHAYNEYVELVIELGLPAMVLFILWIITGLVSSGKRIGVMPRKIQKLTQDEIFIIGSFCSLLGILIHASVDTVWHTSAIALYAVTVLTVLTTIRTKEKTEKHYTPERIFPEKKASTFVPYKGRKRRLRR